MDQRIDYQGHGIGLVDDKGRVAIPAALRQVLAHNAPRRDGKDGGTVIIGAHPEFTCLRAFDPGYNAELRAEVEHRTQTYVGPTGELNYAFKQRGAAGEPVPFDGSGRCVVPDAWRFHANIDGFAFFWGSLDWIEIWDPRTLMEAKGVDPLVQSMCRFHCKQKGVAL